MNFIRAWCGFVAVAATLVPAAARTPQGEATSRFSIRIGGAAAGSETVTVMRTADGWTIFSTGRQFPPVDLATSRFEMKYDANWQPQSLAIEGTVQGAPISLATSFSASTAVSELSQAGQTARTVHTISPRAVILPTNFYGAFEALAARLATVQVGAKLPVYVAPQGEVQVTVDRVTTRQISMPAGTMAIRDFDVTFHNPAGPLKVLVTVDDRARLARILVASSALSVVREDLASVMAREETMRNPNDSDALVPALGFTIAATVTRPLMPASKHPAAVLVGSTTGRDRDETVAGIAVFPQLASAIADAGFMTVRYDQRGLGQSGGRVENADLVRYADDLIDVVKWLKQRKDIDGNRIAVIGYGEGAAIAMIAAAREKSIAAVALVGAPGQTGREVTLMQQQRALDARGASSADRQARVALQLRIMDAVISGANWPEVSADVRQQADTPWFKSWLLFDPAVALSKLRQPVLILQGSLDTEFPPAQSDKLEAAAQSRKGLATSFTRKTVVPGVNHLLVPATTGGIDEYLRLPDRKIAPAAAHALTSWLKDTLLARLLAR